MKKLSLFIAVITYFLIAIIDEQRLNPAFQSYIYSLFLGSVPNFIAVIAYSAVALFFAKNRMEYYRYLLALSISAVGYEILQIWLDWRVFDWLDILFSILGYFTLLSLSMAAEKLSVIFLQNRQLIGRISNTKL